MRRRIRLMTCVDLAAIALGLLLAPASSRASCSSAHDVDILAVIDGMVSVDIAITGDWAICGYTHYNVRWSGGGGTIQQEVPRTASRATLGSKLPGRIYTVSIQGCRSRTLASSVCGRWSSRKFVTCGSHGIPCGHPRLNAPEPLRIVSGAALCLDVHAPDQNKDGGKVQVFACNGSPQQTWVLDKGANRIISLTGKCLDVHAPDQNRDGGRVQVWTCNNSAQQTWFAPDPAEQGAPGAAINARSGKCLDVHAPRQTQNGTPVQVWTCNGLKQQRWRIRKL